MTCPNEEAVGAWLEGALPEADRGAISAHLADCDPCRHLAAAAGLSLRPASIPVSTWAWISTAAAAAVLAAFLVIRGSSPKPSESTTAATPTPVKTAVSTPSAPDAPTPEKPPEETVEIPPSSVPTPEPAEPPTPGPETVKETPNPKVGPAPAPPAVTEPEKPTEPPATAGPGKTVPAENDRYREVSLLDPSGELLCGGDAVRSPRRVSSAEKLTASSPCAFTLEGIAMLALEPGASLSLLTEKGSTGYSIALHSGGILLSCEVEGVFWKVSHEAQDVEVRGLAGVLAVSEEKGTLRIRMLDGRAETSISSLESGQELTLRSGARPATKRISAATVKKELARFERVRPPVFTMFQAGFEETAESMFFPYRVSKGKVVEGAMGCHVAGSEFPERSWRVLAEVSPQRPIPVRSRSVLRFRYRTAAASFEVDFDGYRCTVPGSKEWTAAELPLSRFVRDQVPLVAGDEVFSLRFGVQEGTGRAPDLDVDGIELIQPK